MNLDDIRKLNPCYDPNRYLPEDWQGTVADILRLDACPENDRIWVAVRLIDEKTARLFAVWCAREALARASNPDSRSLAACDVAERYINGEATESDLTEARDAASAAASVAWATDAAWAATEAARAAEATAREKQVAKLLEMVEGRDEK